MSQQTPVNRVEPVWREWMKRWPTPSDLAHASPAEVLISWSTMGYPRRALRLQESARVISERTDGFPRTYEELLELPGVGPWQGEWPDDPRYDPELLQHGDRRNVIDRFRYWTMAAIVEQLDAERHPFHVAIENWQHDMNIGSIVRSANAFGANTVHIVGRKRWNKRGAMVTDRYQHLRHHATVDDLMAWAREEGLTVVAVDNTPGSVALERTRLPRRCLLVFGQEGPGVSDETQDRADLTVSIAQFGSTRSINAGVAAGIVMHTWVAQHADLDQAW